MRAGSMKNGDPRWRPPFVELVDPLMKYRSWTDDQHWSQALHTRQEEVSIKLVFAQRFEGFVAYFTLRS